MKNLQTQYTPTLLYMGGHTYLRPSNGPNYYIVLWFTLRIFQKFIRNVLHKNKKINDQLKSFNVSLYKKNSYYTKKSYIEILR